MNKHGRFGYLCLSLALLAATSACSSMRSASSQSEAHPAPASTEGSTPPAAEAAEPNPPERTSEDSQPSASNAVIPPCLPPETKPKPKVRPKPKPVRREAPPQLPTAPTVTETSSGGVVDAQVKPMPVSVMSILGKRVQGPTGDDLGRVVDVLADASGRVRIAIIDFGGFLGVGNRRIAVDWPLLRFNPDGKDTSLLLSVSRDKLRATPEYKENPRPQTLMEPEPPAAPSPAATAAPAATAPGPAPADNKK